MVDQVELIQDRARFETLVAELAREPVVGIDTEAASFHRYRDRVYLLQLSSATRTFVVDPLAVGGLPGFDRLLERRETQLVFHDGDYDLRLLYHEYGYRVRGLFDTRIAAQFLNEPAIGLGSLLQKYFGVATDKRFQRADWSTRPLTPPMIDYAATDTRHLAALRDRLQSGLEAAGRLEWVEEECQLLTSVEWAPPEPAESAALRMKGARTLDPRGLAVLQQIFAWREAVAAELDRALFRVVGNETLLALSANPPRSREALGKVKGLGRELAATRGDELLAAIERGRAVTDDALPRFPKSRRPKPDPEFEQRLERLKALRNRLVTGFGLAPGVLCPNATLEVIARNEPTSLEALGSLPGVRRWQVAAFGTEVLRALAQGR
ncbi:MAG: ribonuclease D [Gemmatimonadales bacterium]